MVWAVSLLTTKLSPRRLTPGHPQAGILGLVGVGKLAPPSPSSAVPPADSAPGASPKAISGRTSYLRVRLAFHPYPQLIPQICNSGEFGPPRRVSSASAWPWIAHAVSGLLDSTVAPCSDSLSLRLRTAVVLNLQNALPRNSPVHSTKGTPSGAPCGDRPLTACKCMVSGSLSFPSRGAFHLSLTVLVHYRSSRVFSLGGWSPQLPTGCLVSRGTRARTAGRPSPAPTGLSPSLAARSRDVQVGLGFLQLPPRRATSRPVRLSTPLSQPVAGVARESVWAAPRSLATTWGISVDVSSSRY